MKRSDMVEHIFRIVLNSETEFTLSEQEAALLLTHIEAFGMLPPLNEQNYHHMDNDDRITANKAKFIHSWEPE